MPPGSTKSAISRPDRLVATGLWSGLLILPLAGTFGANGLSLAIGTLTLFVGAIITTFSSRYLRADPHAARYFWTVGALVISVVVLAFAANLVLFAAGWIASGILLAQLVGHASDWDEARSARQRTRLNFLVGDLALVAAFVLLVSQTGSLDVPTVLARARLLATPEISFAALLLLVAAAARCALPPFSGWLMSSMTAPTPVSALMHAGLVNAGGFLFLRFAPVFEAAPFARYAAVALGLVAVAWGLGVMMVRADIKGSIAGSTIAQMGFMIMSCGLGAYAAALWHLIAHGLFKAWLFLGSGSAVGMQRTGDRAIAGRSAVTAVTTAAVVVGALLVLSGRTAGELIPLALGLTTAFATFVASARGGLAFPARLSLIAALALLFGFNVLGFLLARKAIGPDGPDLLGSWALLGLLLAFLASWLWQRSRIERCKPLPPAIYIRLMNAGALR